MGYRECFEAVEGLIIDFLERYIFLGYNIPGVSSLFSLIELYSTFFH